MPAISPRSFAECNRLHAEGVKRLAETAKREYCRNINTELYVYGSEYIGNIGTGFGDLQASNEPPTIAHSILITEHIPRCLTVQQTQNWIEDRLRRTPLASFAD